MAWPQTILNTLMLYKYDSTIFDGFRVPGDIDKNTVIDAILTRTADLSVIYTSPEYIKNMIMLWTNKNFSVWNELYKTLHYDYNPIHNYDRTEDGWDTLDGKQKETRDLTNVDDYSRDLQDASNNLDKIAAFNEGLADHGAQSGTINYTGTSKDTKKDTGTIDNKTDNINHHYLRAFGNIGVTTTKELIQAQRELVQFNLIDFIVDDYMTNFCVMVY